MWEKYSFPKFKKAPKLSKYELILNYTYMPIISLLLVSRGKIANLLLNICICSNVKKRSNWLVGL